MEGLIDEDVAVAPGVVIIAGPGMELGVVPGVVITAGPGMEHFAFSLVRLFVGISSLALEGGGGSKVGFVASCFFFRFPFYFLLTLLLPSFFFLYFLLFLYLYLLSVMIMIVVVVID